MGPPRFVPAMLRLMPGVWRRLTKVAHTLPYDAKLVEARQTGNPFATNE
jgi:hypothetical protein